MAFGLPLVGLGVLGSKVLFIPSCVVFALAERKNGAQEDRKYLAAEHPEPDVGQAKGY